MTRQVNQFKPTPTKGQLVYGRENGFIQPVIIDPASAETFTPGTPVKIIDKDDAYVPVVEKCANTDIADGLIILSLRKENPEAGDEVEIAQNGNVMYLTAGAAIAGGALVAYNSANDSVITAAGTSKILGKCLSKVGNGELAKIQILSPLVAQV